MVVNARLRENPALQRMPKTEREWTHYQNELAKWVLKVATFGDGSIITSTGTQVDGLDEIEGSVHLGDGSIKTAGEVQIDGLDEMTGSVHLGDGSIKTSGGTQIDGLDEMPGTLADGDALPTVTTLNKGSTQNSLSLTSDDVGATTTITIASHSVTYDVGIISYNAGSVTGLGFSTEYHVSPAANKAESPWRGPDGLRGPNRQGEG